MPLLRAKGLHLAQLHVEERAIGYDYTKITQSLYLGSADLANDPDSMRRLHITHVVDCRHACARDSSCSSSGGISNSITHLRLPVKDEPAQAAIIMQDLKKSFEHIEAARIRGGACFLCCSAGMSRSVTHAIAYLMRWNRCSLLDALQLVKDKRASASPNEGFMEVLVKYERELETDVESTVDLDVYRNDRFSSVEELRSCAAAAASQYAYSARHEPAAVSRGSFFDEDDDDSAHESWTADSSEDDGNQ